MTNTDERAVQHYEANGISYRQTYLAELQMHKMEAADAVAEMQRLAKQRDTLSWVCGVLVVALIAVAIALVRR